MKIGMFRQKSAAGCGAMPARCHAAMSVVCYTVFVPCKKTRYTMRKTRNNVSCLFIEVHIAVVRVVQFCQRLSKAFRTNQPAAAAAHPRWPSWPRRLVQAGMRVHVQVFTLMSLHNFYQQKP